MNFEWANLIIGATSLVVGGASGMVAGVWRIARIEGRITAHFKQQISDSESRIEEKLEQSRSSFDETLKGLRQKINDVELETERGFVAKGDFDDFRKEYREDMREIKASITSIPRARE